jgi:hypothetical protein
MRHRRALLPLGGVAIGLGYLVRPEGLGLVLPLGAWLVSTHRPRAAVVVALVAAVVAAPYVGYLRHDTGHWMVSRKAANVLTTGIEAAVGGADVVSQRESSSAAVMAVLRSQWRAYLKKLAVDSGRTFVAFAECLFLVWVPFLLLGIWRGDVRRGPVNGLLHRVVWFYVVLFALIYVDRRFYTALVPLAMIWCGSGLAWAGARAAARGRAAAVALVAVVFAVALGAAVRVSDAAGWTRELGAVIARQGAQRPLVAARDLRVAYYAGGRQVEVRFPLDAARVLPLLDGGADWLVVEDGDITPDGRVVLEKRSGHALPVTTVAEKGGRMAHLYRLRRAS